MNKKYTIGLAAFAALLLLVLPTIAQNFAGGSNGAVYTLPTVTTPLQGAQDLILAANQTLASNTTLVAVNNSTVTLAAGKTYVFTWDGQENGTATAGEQAAFNGTATATAFNMFVTSISSNSTAAQGFNFTGGNTTLGGNVGAVTQTSGLNLVHAVGFITVNATGTFAPQMAQQASNSTAITVLAGADFHIALQN